MTCLLWYISYLQSKTEKVMWMNEAIWLVCCSHVTQMKQFNVMCRFGPLWLGGNSGRRSSRCVRRLATEQQQHVGNPVRNGWQCRRTLANSTNASNTFSPLLLGTRGYGSITFHSFSKPSTHRHTRQTGHQVFARVQAKHDVCWCALLHARRSPQPLSAERFLAAVQSWRIRRRPDAIYAIQVSTTTVIIIIHYIRITTADSRRSIIRYDVALLCSIETFWEVSCPRTNREKLATRRILTKFSLMHLGTLVYISIHYLFIWKHNHVAS